MVKYAIAHASAAPSSSSSSAPSDSSSTSSSKGYAATLKAAYASTLFSVPLTAASVDQSSEFDSFFHGPALLASDGSGSSGSGGRDVAFGGNGIAKFLSLVSPSPGATGGSSGSGLGGGSGGGSGRYGPRVDEWLEFERTVLRPSLSSVSSSSPSTSEGKGGGSTKKIAAALTKLDDALSPTTGGGGKGGGTLHLVGNSDTAADVAIVVTLFLASQRIADLLNQYDNVKRYVAAHVTSPKFLAAVTMVDSGILLPTSSSTKGAAATQLDYQTESSQIKAVTTIFTDAIAQAFPDYANVDPVVQKCSSSKFGDYQCNAAMRLFGTMKKDGGKKGGGKGGLPDGITSPQDVASAIVSEVENQTTNGHNPVIDSLGINGPGFITCKIQSSYLDHHLNLLLRDGIPKPSPPSSTHVQCLVDFSSPNIAKEMHVGHLRSTIIGESVCRILEFAGHDVARINHVGDWGTQFGMLIQYLREEYPQFAKGEEVNITDLTVFYKNAKKRFDDDEVFKDRSRLNVVELQAGDEECRTIWKILCDISRKEFDKVYERLDVTVTECGESFYNDKIAPVIEEFDTKGLLSVEEGGAKCVWIPDSKFSIPLMVQKSDGGYGYDSTDMAALKYRLFDVGAKRTIYITDYSQADHFKMCFAAAELIGWVEPGVHRLEHIGFGTVQGEDGKRFKTRSGETVRLVDLLDEAVRRQEEGLAERIEANTAGITRDMLHETACALGYGAVKYFDLRRNPTTNYIFSYDRMLDLKGNTAIYLLYAHARLESIMRKAKERHGVDVDDLVKPGSAARIVIGHPSERNLAVNLQMFADTIETTLEDLYPYHICDFLYSAATAASEFVTQCKVLGSPEMESRLLLCRATTVVMRQCFELLGIKAVYRI